MIGKGKREILCGKGTTSIIRSQFPKAICFHCSYHKLNICVAQGDLF